MIEIYTDGACSGNPGPGGWGAIIISNGSRREIKGHEASTTNNRMEMIAAVKGLENTLPGSPVTLYSDSQYLVNTMTKNWKRNKNVDLWDRLDRLAEERKVRWKWVQGHNGHPEQERAHALASGLTAAGGSGGLTHFDDSGRPRMVDVTAKPVTEREATARGSVVMSASTLELVRQGKMAKGDVLAVAQLAGIMAAKQTPYIIPLCHPLPISGVAVDLQINPERAAVEITATVKTAAQTGVEMEAMTAVAVAALTVYDMCKAAERGIRIEDIHLVKKSGGRSGEIVLE